MVPIEMIAPVFPPGRTPSSQSLNQNLKENFLVKTLKLTFGLSVLALGISSAASAYKVTVYESVWVGGTELKAGDYKVEMVGDKAVFKMGKSTVEIPATFAANDQKYKVTALVTDHKQLRELEFGGTADKIVFAAPVDAAQTMK
jgi:hypothetical protein